MIRVALVDDQTVVRLGYRMILDQEADMRVVGEAPDGHAAVELVRVHRPDVVVMDVRMPRLDGIAATEAILALRVTPAPRVLVVTTFDLDEYVFGAIGAGASGFLLKDAPPAELVRAVRVVAAGDAVVSPRATRELIARYRSGAARSVADDRLDLLTTREREVLVALARGGSNADVGRELHLSEATVKTHVSRVMAKLGVRSRVQAVVMAFELGLDRTAGAAPSRGRSLHDG